MTYAKRILGVVVAVGMIVITAPSGLWAESAPPNDDAANLFPGATAAYFDPNASGTKFSGTLTIAYASLTPDVTVCGPGPEIPDMYVVLTLQQGNQRVPFTTHALNICFGSVEQTMVILDLISVDVIPSLYSCDPEVTGACPNFKVKSLTNFQYTTGAQSMDITIAVR